MKLSEVLEALLQAEDEAEEMRGAAEREAKAIIREAHDKFAQNQEVRLAAAREETRAQVESAGHSMEIETRYIAELSEKARERMQEHFDRRVPDLIAKITGKIAQDYAAHGRA